MEDFLNPQKILNQLKLRKDMVAADFGSGSGFWVLPLAKILEEGKVFAIDILEEPLSALRLKTKLEKISNIEMIKADVEEGSRMLNDSCDLVLMTNLLFQSEKRNYIFQEAKRVLKKNGKILVVDWKEDAPFGPKTAVSLSEVKKIAEEESLKLEKEFEPGKYHYGLLFQK
ncbi:MAG: class I SAM-dependent methyltransferase [bacterium]